MDFSLSRRLFLGGGGGVPPRRSLHGKPRSFFFFFKRKKHDLGAYLLVSGALVRPVVAVLTLMLCTSEIHIIVLGLSEYFNVKLMGQEDIITLPGGSFRQLDVTLRTVDL